MLSPTQHTAPQFNFPELPISVLRKRATLCGAQKQAYLPSPRPDPTHNTTHSPLVASRALFKAHSHIGEGRGVCDVRTWERRPVDVGPGIQAPTRTHNARPPTRARIYNILIYKYFTRARIYYRAYPQRRREKREGNRRGFFFLYIFLFRRIKGVC